MPTVHVIHADGRTTVGIRDGTSMLAVDGPSSIADEVYIRLFSELRLSVEARILCEYLDKLGG